MDYLVGIFVYIWLIFFLNIPKTKFLCSNLVPISPKKIFFQKSIVKNQKNCLWYFEMVYRRLVIRVPLKDSSFGKKLHGV